MKSYIDNNLQQDEHIKMIAEINKLSLIKPILIIGLCVIFFFGPFMNYVNNNDYSISTGILIVMILIAVIICSIIDLIKILIYIFSSVLAFTNKRIISKKGLLSIKALDSPIDKINDFNIKQSIFGKIFNYSKVVIKTSSSQYEFDYVKNALKFKNLLVTSDKVQKVEIQDVNNKTISKYDELSKLKELLDKNVITQEEFEKKKKELLNI